MLGRSVANAWPINCQRLTDQLPTLYLADVDPPHLRCQSSTSQGPTICIVDAKSLELDPSRYRFFAFATTFFAAFFTASLTRFAALFRGGFAPFGNTITRLPSNATTICAIFSTPALRNSAA